MEKWCLCSSSSVSADGGAVVDAAQPIDGVGLEEQGIGQAGLARGPVPDECNVPDVLHQVLDGHEWFL